MKRKINIVLILISVINFNCFSQSVNIQFDKTSEQQLYAASKLEKTLRENNYSISNSSADNEIQFNIDSVILGNESFSISTNKKLIEITGGDERGLIYGALSLVEDLRNGIELQNCIARNEKPFLSFRTIKYDLPWDTYRHSYALDIHDQTCRDTSYWETFLDMMVENRFNGLSLWNLHPYTFLIKPKNFPEASPWSDIEMKEWQMLFHSIIRMADERAIDTYIIPFNIFVTPEFAKAHNVAMDNLEHDYYVPGDTSEIIKQYTRECVTQMLEEYPKLTGMGLTLGEGMGGMTPAQREEWIRETIIEGMRLANRKSKLIHRIPFSSTTASLGTTSKDTEELTRKIIEEEAELGCFEGPIWADLKFNWSHAHSTPNLMKVHGGKLYDTYFNPDPDAYKIVWTARNEDFFCLRWGVPSFVRQHITQNKQSYSGGYIIGSETYIPAKDYFTKDTVDIPWKYAFERQWLFYKLWGRLLYNPATPDDVFKAEFIKRYGSSGRNLLSAFSHASSTQLKLASIFDCTWDFTLYGEGMMALDNTTRRVDYISIDRLINQPPLDSNYVSIAEYVSTQLTGGKFRENKITPDRLATMLVKDCYLAIDLVKEIDFSQNKALKYEVYDVAAWSYLGLHLSEKIKGGINLQKFRLTGDESDRKKAVDHLQSALLYWDKLIEITEPLYNEMPLQHLSQQEGKPWKENYNLRFHWKLIRPDVARDVETARKSEFRSE
ncbi:MAG: hypothetical protein HQ541_14300 [Mariniphaga sp.]|nr:hypothetical protein [Mariniphaga sp.]